MMPQSSVKSETSDKVRNLGLVCSLFVVAIHVGWVVSGPYGQVAATVLIKSLARIAVPFFFIVSGYFLAVHFDEKDWWRRALRKRARTLLVPYVFWLTIYALFMLAVSGRLVIGLGGYGFNLCRMPMMGALWYVRCLMIFIIISPLLKSCVDRWGIKWILAVYAANIVTSILTGSGILEYESGIGGLLGYGVSVEGLVYFSLGMYLQSHRIESRPSVAATGLLVGCVLIGIRIFLDLHGIRYGIHPSVLISPCLLLGCWYLTPSATWPSWLTSCGFPIYLLHGIALSVYRTWGLSRAVGGQWMTLVVGIVVPMVVYHALRRWFPKLCSILFGGR